MRHAMVSAAMATVLAAHAAPVLADDGRAFRTCAEARAAGFSNIRRGSSGYGPHLDRDGVGIACEP